ncbi:MAG: hypothetical protein ACO3QM_06725 [Candidatus Nanopelagicaceae bacterium]
MIQARHYSLFAAAAAPFISFWRPSSAALPPPFISTLRSSSADTPIRLLLHHRRCSFLNAAAFYLCLADSFSSNADSTRCYFAAAVRFCLEAIFSSMAAAIHLCLAAFLSSNAIRLRRRCSFLPGSLFQPHRHRHSSLTAGSQRNNQSTDPFYCCA